MLAPHSQAIQTWLSLPPLSSSPQRRCSWRKAFSADGTSGIGRDATTSDEPERSANERAIPASTLAGPSGVASDGACPALVPVLRVSPPAAAQSEPCGSRGPEKERSRFRDGVRVQNISDFWRP